MSPLPAAACSTLASGRCRLLHQVPGRARARVPRTQFARPRAASARPASFPSLLYALLAARSRRLRGAALRRLLSFQAKMAESGEVPGTVPEHERILQEIESTDTACVGPTLR